MDDTVIQRLLMLNIQFYQTFAHPFSQSRKRLQPGVLRILRQYLLDQPLVTKILDLGCGNGELAHTLYQSGFSGEYHGIDFNQAFLDEARLRNMGNSKQCVFQDGDLTTNTWCSSLNYSKYHALVSFAALHHIPSAVRRMNLLRECHALLDIGGLLIYSVWQFRNSVRLANRIVPCEMAGFNPAELEPDDTILDWRQGGYGYRYVHHFPEGELAGLAQLSGFIPILSFYSDGREGNLARYQVWQKG